jgi:uncharacterized protein (TIGR02246 family)
MWCQSVRTAPLKPQQQDIDAIRDLERRDIQTSKANDLDALVSLWTDDGVLLQPGSAPVGGKDAIRTLLEDQKQQSAGTVTTEYAERWRELRIVGDYAFEWGEMSATIKFSSGKLAHQQTNAIRVLRRDNGHLWKVARVAVTPAAKP